MINRYPRFDEKECINLLGGLTEFIQALHENGARQHDKGARLIDFATAGYILKAIEAVIPIPADLEIPLWLKECYEATEEMNKVIARAEKYRQETSCALHEGC